MSERGFKVNRDAVTEDQVRLLFEKPESSNTPSAAKLGAILSCLFDLGLRAVEARHLRMRDLEFDQDGTPVAVSVTRSKTPAGIRRLPLPPRASRMFSRWLRWRQRVLDEAGVTSDWLLCTHTHHAGTKLPHMNTAQGDMRGGKPGRQLPHSTLYQVVKHRFARCGIPWAATHTGRRSFATNLARSEVIRGNPVMGATIVAAALGHKSPVSSFPYFRTTRQEVDEAILAAATGPTPPQPTREQLLIERLRAMLEEEARA